MILFIFTYFSHRSINWFPTTELVFFLIFSKTSTLDNLDNKVANPFTFCKVFVFNTLSKAITKLVTAVIASSFYPVPLLKLFTKVYKKIYIY